MNAREIYDALATAKADGATVRVFHAKQLSDLMPGDVITSEYKPGTGRGGSRVSGHLTAARIESAQEEVAS
jgi:hypothetical protein